MPSGLWWVMQLQAPPGQRYTINFGMTVQRNRFLTTSILGRQLHDR